MDIFVDDAQKYFVTSNDWNPNRTNHHDSNIFLSSLPRPRVLLEDMLRKRGKNVNSNIPTEAKDEKCPAIYVNSWTRKRERGEYGQIGLPPCKWQRWGRACV